MFLIMDINDFRGDLHDTSAKAKITPVQASHVDVQVLTAACQSSMIASEVFFKIKLIYSLDTLIL